MQQAAAKDWLRIFAYASWFYISRQNQWVIWTSLLFSIHNQWSNFSSWNISISLKPVHFWRFSLRINLWGGGLGFCLFVGWPFSQGSVLRCLWVFCFQFTCLKLWEVSNWVNRQMLCLWEALSEFPCQPFHRSAPQWHCKVVC